MLLGISSHFDLSPGVVEAAGLSCAVAATGVFNDDGSVAGAGMVGVGLSAAYEALHRGTKTPGMVRTGSRTHVLGRAHVLGQAHLDSFVAGSDAVDRKLVIRQSLARVEFVRAVPLLRSKNPQVQEQRIRNYFSQLLSWYTYGDEAQKTFAHELMKTVVRAQTYSGVSNREVANFIVMMDDIFAQYLFHILYEPSEHLARDFWQTSEASDFSRDLWDNALNKQSPDIVSVTRLAEAWYSSFTSQEPVRPDHFSHDNPLVRFWYALATSSETDVGFLQKTRSHVLLRHLVGNHYKTLLGL